MGGLNPVEKRGNRKNKEIVETLLPVKNNEDSERESYVEFNGASFGGAVFNLSTTIVGAGIMALPATMKVLGLIPGLLLIVFGAVLAESSIELLVRFSRVCKAASYGEVMGDTFGRVGKMLLQVCVLVNNTGVLIVYMIIIGDVLSGTSSSGTHHSGVLEGWFGAHWWNGRFFVILVTTLCCFTPLACFKRIDSLRYTSAISVALAVVFVVITAGIAIVKIISGGVSMPQLFPQIVDFNSVWNLFTCVPVLVTAYICHYNVHTIDNELEDSSQIKPIVRTSLFLCSSVYLLTSFFAFLLFGPATLDDVLANFDSDLGIPYSSVLEDAVRVSYAVHLMLVFPMIFHALSMMTRSREDLLCKYYSCNICTTNLVGVLSGFSVMLPGIIVIKKHIRLNLDGLLFPNVGRRLEADNRRFGGITAGILVVVFGAAIFIPSIWDAFQITGATAAVCIGFIFPAAIALRDRHKIATRKDMILSIVMIVLAVLSNAVAVYSDVYSLFHKGNDSQV